LDKSVKFRNYLERGLKITAIIGVSLDDIRPVRSMEAQLIHARFPAVVNGLLILTIPSIVIATCRVISEAA
jgi:hypothetical protein